MSAKYFHCNCIFVFQGVMLVSTCVCRGWAASHVDLYVTVAMIAAIGQMSLAVARVRYNVLT